jgi:hypothetical protein
MISGTGIRVIAMGMVSIVFPYMFADSGPRFLLEVARGLQVPGSSHDAWRYEVKTSCFRKHSKYN